VLQVEAEMRQRRKRLVPREALAPVRQAERLQPWTVADELQDEGAEGGAA